MDRSRDLAVKLWWTQNNKQLKPTRYLVYFDNDWQTSSGQTAKNEVLRIAQTSVHIVVLYVGCRRICFRLLT